MMFKKELIMKNILSVNIIVQCVFSLIPFVIINILTKIFFQEMYLLDWFSRHGYCGLWLIVGIIAIFNFKLAFIISCSNSIAIVLGQIIGDVICEYNFSKITSDMSLEQQAQLYVHHGFTIWFLLLLLSVGGYFIITKMHSMKKRKAYQ